MTERNTVGRQVLQTCAKGNICRKDWSSMALLIPFEGHVDHTSMGKLGQDTCLDTRRKESMDLFIRPKLLPVLEEGSTATLILLLLLLLPLLLEVEMVLMCIRRASNRVVVEEKTALPACSHSFTRSSEATDSMRSLRSRLETCSLRATTVCRMLFWTDFCEAVEETIGPLGVGPLRMLLTLLRKCSKKSDCTISTAHDLVRMAIVADTLLVISELWLK